MKPLPHIRSTDAAPSRLTCAAQDVLIGVYGLAAGAAIIGLACVAILLFGK